MAERPRWINSRSCFHLSRVAELSDSFGFCSAGRSANQAARYCRRLLILNDGRVAASGAPAAALSDEVLRETFKVRGVRHAGALVGFAPTSAPPRGHHEGL